MASIRQVQAVLETGARLRVGRLSAATGIPSVTINKRVTKWLRNGHISRETCQDKPGFRYFMTTEQIERYRLHVMRQEPKHVDLSVDAFDSVSRIGFLLHLKEKTVFAEYKALDLIIGDYQRALSKANAEGEAAPRKTAGRKSNQGEKVGHASK
jgi:hypothetical protein